MTHTTSDRRLATLAVLAIGALLVLPGLGMGFGMMGMGPMTGGMWGHMGDVTAVGGWTVLLGVGMQLLFLAVLVGGGYLAYRALGDGTTSTDPALEELRAAYARGDIDDDEYERRRSVLERDPE
jgi:putative membrane protein